MVKNPCIFILFFPATFKDPQIIVETNCNIKQSLSLYLTVYCKNNKKNDNNIFNYGKWFNCFSAIIRHIYIYSGC